MIIAVGIIVVLALVYAVGVLATMVILANQSDIEIGELQRISIAWPRFAFAMLLVYLTKWMK